ncbi:hypothetical protein QAD02_020133 [Eretmocerus hayati]|uniref:Uncharacterized protein n=1 Tax=Eretmocerus hayati TaxID=131215 RepID=A0ACC2PNF8_9HYME|nr:hypothetical protein QAD02_020133 [Eretmocerus hayati]
MLRDPSRFEQQVFEWSICNIPQYFFFFPEKGHGGLGGGKKKGGKGTMTVMMMGNMMASMGFAMLGFFAMKALVISSVAVLLAIILIFKKGYGCNLLFPPLAFSFFSDLKDTPEVNEADAIDSKRIRNVPQKK